ncbi:MAG: hypothetical protein PHD68_03630 [Rugosibacter sp.]|nr:hypothetical protein [Rugosibacter sp.]
MPKLYIDEFVGISNRLEVLPLAFAIRAAYGHDIILDWHELDSFSVDDTTRGKVRLLARIGALRVRDCDAALFAALGNKKIILRSLDGPSEVLDPIYLAAAAKVHLAPHLVAAVHDMFNKTNGRPVVGVHIRQGDYQLVSEARYDISQEWPAVPVWWYEKTMEAIAKKQPDVCFFLSCTGDPAAFRKIHERFNVFTLNVPSSYDYKGDDHRSSVNPVADLFALACCPTILATPISGYSHWAANALGHPSACIVPLPGATPEQPNAGVVRLYGRRLPIWRAAGRTGSDTLPLKENLDGIDFTLSAHTDWL